MPRKNKLSVDDAVAIISEFQNHFDNGNLPIYSHPVWKEMSEKCQNVWSAQTWWVNVKYNRRGISSLAKLSLDTPCSLTNVTVSPESDMKESIYTDNCKFDTCEGDEMWFDLLLNSDEWEQIKPLRSKGILTLRPWVWTNIVADAFYRQHRLPCVYTFRKNEVKTSFKRKYFIKIIGMCRSKKCANIFKGFADTEPSLVTGELCIHVKTRNTRGQIHEIVQHPLNGKRLKQVGKETIAKKCLNLQREMARKNLCLRDTEAPIIPSLDVLRHAEKEAIDEELGSKQEKDEDEIRAIYYLNFQNPYIGSIISVSYLPFQICYGTSEQIWVYKQYYGMNKNTLSISIGATGRVVRKLKRPLETKSAHIFLYVIVIHFDNRSLSVFQLLTESQETETIEHWLKMWLRIVKFHKPVQVVVNYSRAMLSACSKAFNDITLKKYIEICFKAVSAEEHVPRDWISTYIRVDVTHLIRLVYRWPPLKDHPLHLVRDFYIRCVALMIDCQTYQDFMEIFSLTCIVALQTYQDSDVNVEWIDQRITTAKQSREKLESLIQGRPADVDNYLKINDSDNIELDDDVDQVHVENSKINEFFEKIKIEAQLVIREGKETNYFYLPKFIDHLLRIAKEFPLWTAVCIPFYTSHPTTSYCEKIFQDIEYEVCKNYPLPQRIDSFIKLHIPNLIESTRDFSSKIQTFIVNREVIPVWKPNDLHQHTTIQPIVTANLTNFNDDAATQYFITEHTNCVLSTSINDLDLLSRENWRIKAEPLFSINESQKEKECILSDM